MRIISPRRDWHSSISVPVYSEGVRIVQVSHGSSMRSIEAASGIAEGLSISITSPVTVWTS